MNRVRPLLPRGIVAAGLVLAACSPGSGAATDSPASGGAASGGASAASGGSETGGSSALGGTSTGGSPSSGGAPAASGGQNTTSGGAPGTGGSPSLSPVTLQLMESVVFYDAYAGTVDEPVADGVVRLDNSLFATRLTAEQLAQIQSHLTLDVTIGALCDNYDRIGSVRLALVPKAQSSYGPNEGSTRIELGRFITPFMDKNAQPDEVPYRWQIDHVAAILRSTELQAANEFWFELSVFGVPYAANDEVAGCAERSDVFRGWLSLSTDSTAPDRQLDVLLPLAFDEAFNDYQAGASDAIGTTKKTIGFSLDSSLEDAEVVLIVSNHGANSGGEEYIRREHIALLDGEPALEFTPGRSSCEPFRMFNTQANGIYGSSPRSDADWQSFSNWCPGDVIDIRRIPWEAASAGTHEFALDVPDAVFTGDEGNFPLSVFVIGRRAGP